jgi:hypothetical protein
MSEAKLPQYVIDLRKIWERDYLIKTKEEIIKEERNKKLSKLLKHR